MDGSHIRKKASLSSFESVSQHISQAQALIGIYEKNANAEIGNRAELGQVQREMKIIKSELLAELMRSKSALQKMQAQEGGK